jgi:hypothetical protein
MHRARYTPHIGIQDSPGAYLRHRDGDRWSAVDYGVFAEKDDLSGSGCSKSGHCDKG